MRGDVSKGLLPALHSGAELQFLDGESISADGVTPRAEAAVNRAGIQRQKERLVAVTMGEARHGGVGLLAERVEPQAGVIPLLPRSQRHELRADGIVEWDRSNR